MQQTNPTNKQRKTTVAAATDKYKFLAPSFGTTYH
tara:strand:+ start:385 stop:489 length:105 start_codon:yes stop_codon:yes gene_type:complete